MTGSAEGDKELGQHAMAWLPVVLTIARGMLTALKSWVEACAAAGGAEDQCLDNWPLLRLLPDGYAWKQLTAVAQLWLLPATKLLPPEGVAMVGGLGNAHYKDTKKAQTAWSCVCLFNQSCRCGCFQWTPCAGQGAVFAAVP